MKLRPPSVTVSTHTSAVNAVAFQSPALPNGRMSLCTQSVHSFFFPPRPLRTAPSRFPNTIRFGSRPPLINFSLREILARILPAEERSPKFPGDKRRFYEEFFGSLGNGTEISTLSQYWMMPTTYQVHTTGFSAALTHASSHTNVAPRALTNVRGRTAVLAGMMIDFFFISPGSSRR